MAIRILLFVCVVAALASAQERTGSLTGSVADRTGGAIEDAELVLGNKLTGFERKTRSGAEGAYSFPLVPTGTGYRIRVSKEGFSALLREGIAIHVNTPARADLTLDVQSAEQSVTVAADALQVNTQNATGGVTIEERKIAALPLNGRNFLQLGTLIPGAVPVASRYEVQGLAAARAGFSVNGARIQSNNFLLDGVSNNDPQFNGYALTPPPDALDQFKIIASTFSAEYGQSAGSVVNAISKSGNNEYHGRLWNFLRNDKFDARTFFSIAKPPLRQNQYGAAGGGRLVRDRTFFFAYYEGLRARVGTVQNVVVLTDTQRTGNLAGVAPAALDPRANNQPFPGGTIPSARIDPISARLIEQFLPRVNSGSDRFNRAPSVATDGEQAGIRGDHRISSGSQLFVRYAYQRSETANPLGAGTFSPDGSRSEDRSHSAVAGHTWTLRPNVLNEFNAAFLRQFGRPATWSGTDHTSLGWAYPATEATAKGLPIVSLTGLFSIGDVAQNWTQLARNTYQAYDNLSWIHGPHSFKMGGDVRAQQIYLVFPNRPNGDFSFTGARAGNAIADFLLGLPAQFRQGGGQPAKHFVGRNAAFYVQDDWKVSRRLTLNLGLRYELPLPYYDKQDRMASFQPGRQSRVRPTAPAGLLFPGDDGVPRGTIPADTDNFAPRFGFAYDVTGNGKTSVRGGYGIFFDAVPGLAVFQNINVPPFNRFIQIDAPPQFANPYAGFAVNPQTDPSRDFPCPCLVIGFSPDFRTPYVQQTQLGIQRQIATNLVAEAGYVGTMGRKLGGYLEVNPAIPGPGATLANSQQRRIHRDYNLIRPTFSRFNSHYHALQTRIEKRYSSGLSFLLGYTWSKAIDFQSSVNLAGETRPQDAFSLNDVRGLAAFHVAHRFVGSYGYELPWRRRGRDAVSRAFGGWMLQGIVSAQTGGPLTVNEPVDLSLRSLGADRPDGIADPNRGPKTPREWFTRTAFQRLPAVAGGQRSGTAGRNTVIGPGLVQTDLSLLKRFPLTDRQALEFRSEWFNAFNRANFRDPGVNIGQPATFGVIQDSRPGRIVQFALKYEF